MYYLQGQEPRLIFYFYFVGIEFLFCLQSLRAGKFFLTASLDLLGCSLFSFGPTMPPCYFLSPPLQPLGLGD